MKVKRIVTLLAAVLLLGGGAFAAPRAERDDFRRARVLYENGMFERAAALFNDIHDRSGDVLARGWSVLCSVRLQEDGSAKAAQTFLSEHPYTGLDAQLRFYTGLNYFDAEDYPAANEAFAQVTPEGLLSDQVSEFTFKKGYSLFETGDLDAAAEVFADAEKMPYSDYTAPSRYSLGYIAYTQERFEDAFGWFGKAAKDPRFKDLSEYYMVECRYMLKDYAYAVEHGVPMYENTPKERAPHLARIISESYLAEGESAKARDYYKKALGDRRDMGREDYFFAGSVLYAARDFEGAVENFSMMTDRTDSIGQVANYQLGYSYIQTGDKVSALDAFKAASESPIDPAIQEDAHFNYAKLSFDLNHNPKVFDAYIAKYPDKKQGDRIYSYVALASLYNRDYAGAVEAYANIDELDSDQKANYMRANYLRAQQLIEGGSWRDAVPLLKAASYYSDKRESFHQLSRYWLAESYYRSDQYTEAVDAFKELYYLSALEGKKEGNRIPYDLAYCYFRNGEYAEAAKWFDMYLEASDPADGPDAALRRADCDFIGKDYAAAIDRYEQAVKRFGYADNLYPWLRAGTAYGLMGKRDKKVQTLAHAFDADPSALYYSEALFELGRAYVATEQTDEAVRCFERLRANTKDKTIAARSLIEMGMIARNQSEYDRALSCYKQVVGEMPGTEYAEEALLAIESIYQSDGRADEYLDYAESVGLNAGKSDSEKEDLYFNAAEQIFQTEDYGKALASLQNYLQRYPEGRKVALADFYVAECYRGLGKKELACDWYRKALQKDDEGSFSETAVLNYATLSYEMEHFQDAYGSYSSLLGRAKAEPARHTARLGMMRSAFRGQDYETALTCAGRVASDAASTEAQKREADYVSAKSNLSLNNRAEAMEIFTRLSASPSTAEGAEATYMLIQDALDRGKYEEVEKKVYAFAPESGAQSYWLAKAYVALGDSFAERGNMKQAKATFESILDGYTPTGRNDDIEDLVRMRLNRLESMMNAE